MIRVNDNYVIDASDLCYSAKRDLHKTNKNGDPVYDTIGYYRTLDCAIKAIVGDAQRRFLAEGEHSLEEAVKVVSRSQYEFEQLLQRVAGGAK